ncbi:amidohydrolase family protein [Methanobacterium petrolearium]|uniref:amidohydrolase family protein n=1 Tax=Methanobacterium petrolearium TaxID=710190 RepID=UPI0030816535
MKHRILTETTPETMVKSMRSSIKDMLSSGTTSFLDFREGDLEGLKLLKKATDDLPINALPLGRHNSFLDPNVELSQVEKACHEIIKSSHGIGLSGFGEVSDKVARLITQICHDEGKLSAIHVAEYETVQKESLERTGKTEVERAIEAGFDLLIHLTSPLDSDLKLVADNNIPIVSCPRSNGTLSVGIPPLKRMWDMGIKLLLGTDNLMFNSPNMFREMEYALKITRGLSKEYFPPKEILKMATVNPGQVFKLNSGCLEEGRRADVMVTQQLSMDPVLSLINRTEPENIKNLISGGIIFFQKK